MVFSQNVSASEIQPYGAGTWNPIGYKETLYIQPNNFERTQIVYSGGGNIKLKFTNATFQTYRVYLYENDGDGTNKKGNDYLNVEFFDYLIYYGNEMEDN